MTMHLFAMLFEEIDKMPTVEYMYLSGVFLAALVFAATYFHNQVGLITLLLVGLLCAQNVEFPNGIDADGQFYAAHWNYSSRMTFVSSVILFFTAIIIKRRRKR